MKNSNSECSGQERVVSTAVLFAFRDCWLESATLFSVWAAVEWGQGILVLAKLRFLLYTTCTSSTAFDRVQLLDVSYGNGPSRFWHLSRRGVTVHNVPRELRRRLGNRSGCMFRFGEDFCGGLPYTLTQGSQSSQQVTNWAAPRQSKRGQSWLGNSMIASLRGYATFILTQLCPPLV